ncbi:MAG: hypothetical protein P1P84_11250 [Deferrisomatales bacterium]|nr:hypothetical protein [Deferrisomatales bacterium]
MERAQPRDGGGWIGARLESAEFRRLAAFIEAHCGIRMPASKRVMLESRLRRRLRSLGLVSFREYCDLALHDRAGIDERIHLVDAVTTNKTDFFREPQHFEVLVREVLPTLMRTSGAGVRCPLAVWSAGCSTGEEPYTLAMVLREVACGLPGFRFGILATDISTSVLTAARRAVYPERLIQPIPPGLRRKYLLKSRDGSRSLVRMGPELRQVVQFRRLNFMDTEFGLREPQDVIFCRNVMIYFDRATQERLLLRFCRHLAPGGYVFLGHSESINGLRLPLRQVAPTVYRHAGAA